MCMRDSGPKFNIVAVEIYVSCTLSRAERFKESRAPPLVKMCKICCDEILLLNFHKGRIDIMCAPTINLAVRAQKAHREEERRYGVFIIISAMPRHGWSKKWVLMSLFWTLRRRWVKNKHRKWPPRHLLYISSHDSFFIHICICIRECAAEKTMHHGILYSCFMWWQPTADTHTGVHAHHSGGQKLDNQQLRPAGVLMEK